MTAILTPYINFRDSARAALEFYETVFGGTLMIRTFGDFHASEEPDEQDRVMHGQLDTPSGFTLMISDTPNRMEFDPVRSFSVSLSGDASDYDELFGYWEKLSANASVVTMPFGETPWGARFGMCVDQFGIPWIVNVQVMALG